jgi:hypothetical protein
MSRWPGTTSTSRCDACTGRVERAGDRLRRSPLVREDLLHDLRRLRVSAPLGKALQLLVAADLEVLEGAREGSELALTRVACRNRPRLPLQYLSISIRRSSLIPKWCASS